jgi:Protein of unknown function (DUF2786)
MDEQTIKRIAKRIAKCLALAISDNPHEAAAAKRQAEALMKKYHLTHEDVAATQVNEFQCQMSSRYRPPFYIAVLAKTIAQAFACMPIAQSGRGYHQSRIRFLGAGYKPELAGYTFAVLSRKIKKDRATYTKTLWRYKRPNKIRMADLFCEQWVYCISQQVSQFAGSDSEKLAIEAYLQKQYQDTLTSYQKKGTELQHQNDVNALTAGRKAADAISLYHPVQRKNNAQIASPLT